MCFHGIYKKYFVLYQVSNIVLIAKYYKLHMYVTDDFQKIKFVNKIISKLKYEDNKP